ncbi:MAG: radical SAM family heme chaperone HemW [Oliverpabstia sp.]
MKKELELYIHIPFCVKKCDYCDFLSGPAGTERQRNYVEALIKEINHCGDFSNYQISSVFIGGGTPSVLPGVWIEEILDSVYGKFELSSDVEISMEANPGTVDQKKLEIYRNSGINRISFGCQSANNRELKLLGRIHTWEEFLESYQMARNAGFDNINVDLMSGLPGQNLASWEATLLKTVQLHPEHISAYSLIIEEGTPFAERELELPDEDEERAMYEYTRDVLSSYGYHQYEISNYAKKGRECRHNLGYWKRTEYLGLGLGSASLLNDIRFSNFSEMDKYLQNCEHPEVIREQTEKLELKDRMAEYMILGLRMTEGVSVTGFRKNFGQELYEIYGDVIEKYRTMELLEQNGDYLRFTRRGISVSNPILADFLP